MGRFFRGGEKLFVIGFSEKTQKSEKIWKKSEKNLEKSGQNRAKTAKISVFLKNFLPSLSL